MFLIDCFLTKLIMIVTALIMFLWIIMTWTGLCDMSHSMVFISLHLKHSLSLPLVYIVFNNCFFFFFAMPHTNIFNK